MAGGLKCSKPAPGQLRALDRQAAELTALRNGEVVRVEILGMHDFTSERKRMSIVVREVPIQQRYMRGHRIPLTGAHLRRSRSGAGGRLGSTTAAPGAGGMNTTGA